MTSWAAQRDKERKQLRSFFGARWNGKLISYLLKAEHAARSSSSAQIAPRLHTPKRYVSGKFSRMSLPHEPRLRSAPSVRRARL